MDRVVSALEGNEYEPGKPVADTYSAATIVPIARNAERLLVEGNSIFPLEFTAARPTGEESGYCREEIGMDIDLGDTNDFELHVSAKEWNPEKYGYGCRLFIPSTEYGGIITDIESVTTTSEVITRGDTWRGMLAYKVVEPPHGEDHLTLSGELNSVLRKLIGDRFGGLFFVPNIDTGINVGNWQVDRYVTLYDSIMKLMDQYGCRLKIQYIEPKGLEYGYVSIQAVKVTDYSEELECSIESNVNVDIRDYRGGINHLVCAGKGENEERIILHLYVQKDGNVGKTQYYYGLSERAAVYDFSSADLEKLEEDGTKRLKELKNYKKCEMTVDDIDLELGDIVSGYDHVTGTQVIKPIIGKILKIQNGIAKIEYKVKGDD